MLVLVEIERKGQNLSIHISHRILGDPDEQPGLITIDPAVGLMCHLLFQDSRAPCLRAYGYERNPTQLLSALWLFLELGMHALWLCPSFFWLWESRVYCALECGSGRILVWSSLLFFIAEVPMARRPDYKPVAKYKSVITSYFIPLWDILPYLEQVGIVGS